MACPPPDPLIVGARADERARLRPLASVGAGVDAYLPGRRLGLGAEVRGAATPDVGWMLDASVGLRVRLGAR